ncbi:MAG: hypothetical protein KW788_03915 [Candidatus Doudnabacteria bacterium]|nr:hypothetical protein [Candidatus Doudnabacteria bacterium]
MSAKRQITSDPSLIPVSVGDRIRADFKYTFGAGEREKTGLVLKIQRRYGHHGNFVRTAPLLYVKIDGKEKPQYFDQGFVVEVLEHYHGPQRPPENIFREATRGRIGYWHPVRRGLWQGNLIGLVCHVLGNHHAMITHQLDEDKLEMMFRRTRPGYVGNDFSTVVVKAEPFKRWVKKNYSKFLATTAELDSSQTESNEDISSIMDADLDALEASEEGETQEGSCFDSYYD